MEKNVQNEMFGTSSKMIIVSIIRLMMVGLSHSQIKSHHYGFDIISSIYLTVCFDSYIFLCLCVCVLFFSVKMTVYNVVVGGSFQFVCFKLKIKKEKKTFNHNSFLRRMSVFGKLLFAMWMHRREHHHMKWGDNLIHSKEITHFCRVSQILRTETHRQRQRRNNNKKMNPHFNLNSILHSIKVESLVRQRTQYIYLNA